MIDVLIACKVPMWAKEDTTVMMTAYCQIPTIMDEIHILSLFHVDEQLKNE